MANQSWISPVLKLVALPVVHKVLEKDASYLRKMFFNVNEGSMGSTSTSDWIDESMLSRDVRVASLIFPDGFPQQLKKILGGVAQNL